ncbi:MAG TPA: glycosyltransferase family 1 protein [Burkholderiales bacterium]|nr:glycosyltransferase family 1 protein [Burkholderiales bacterium]
MIHYDARWGGPHGIGRFADEVIARLPDARPLSLPVRRLSLLDPVATALAALRLREGVYFTPGFNPPPRSAVPVVFCIHDLIHLRFPAESTALRRAYYRLVVAPAAQRAARILTVSEFSRREILDWTGLPEERVVVAGDGVSAAFTPDGPRHGPGYPYFLYVGRREPHKNLPGLLAAFASSRCRADAKLLLTGDPDGATLDLARRLGISERIAFAGTLDDAELAAHYRGAIALAMPSFYEGFGLPMVEAMACGTSVLASNVTALPEIAGEGNALLVDPAREDAIRQALDEFASNAELRNRLKNRGVARAAQFSWARVGAAVAKQLAGA